MTSSRALRRPPLFPFFLFGIASGCGADGSDLEALAAGIEPVPDLEFIRIKGVVDGTDEDGTYLRLLSSLRAEEARAELEGYIATGDGTTWQIETLLTPEILVYDDSRLYLFMTDDECEIELEGYYAEPGPVSSATEAWYLRGRMAVSYSVWDEELEVGGEGGAVQWFIEFPKGAL